MFDLCSEVLSSILSNIAKKDFSTKEPSTTLATIFFHCLQSSKDDTTGKFSKAFAIPVKTYLTCREAGHVLIIGSTLHSFKEATRNWSKSFSVMLAISKARSSLAWGHIAKNLAEKILATLSPPSGMQNAIQCCNMRWFRVEVFPPPPASLPQWRRVPLSAYMLFTTCNHFLCLES